MGNAITALPADEFEALCVELLRDHVRTVCDGNQFTSPLPPHHADCDPAQFRFARWAGEPAYLWLCSFDSTPTFPIPTVKPFLGVWHCKYFHDGKLTDLGNPEAARIIAEACRAILSAFEEFALPGIVKELHGVNWSYTVLTNLPEHPGSGEPTLLEMLHRELDTQFPRLFLQIGTAATIRFQSEARRVYTVDITPEIIHWLSLEPARCRLLSAEQFELLIADRLCKEGHGVQRVGRTNQGDGGIDLLAWPEKGMVPYLLAVQVKHHSSEGKTTGPGAVRDLRGAIEALPVSMGLLVTNTRFTANARWAAAQEPRIIRLRDMADLAKWLLGELEGSSHDEDPPHIIEVAPGLRIEVPKRLLF